jgi:prepilin-type N-terminal cleavage/methylation domain-containing protein
MSLGSGPAGRRGFTLLEILLALSLIALLAGVLVTGTTNLLQEKAQTPTEVLLKAIAESRRLAVQDNCEVSLAFNKDNRVFTLTSYQSGTGVAAATFPVAAEGDFGLDFLVARKGNSVLIGGVLVETATVPAVSFYADGTCTAFRVQLTGVENPEVIAIDPWTCAPVLDKDKKSAQP